MKSVHQTRVELAFLATIALVCIVLSVLQYRWAGELSRAEPALLRAGLHDQVRRLVQAFDDEIRENCMMLLPDANEIRQLGIAEAHRIHYMEWVSSENRNLFARIGIAAPENGTVRLYGIDDMGELYPMKWPPAWDPFRERMQARLKGLVLLPNAPQGLDTIEVPLFAASAAGPGMELEWMLFDPNEEYLGNKVLPRLVTEYLNPGAEPEYDVSVSQAGQGRVIFATRDRSSVLPGADLTASIFSTYINAPGLSRGRFPDQSRWTIAVRHRAGSLEAAVSQVRTRNLAASLVLVALLAGTAWALVRYTARSRRLAEMQVRFAAGVSHDLRTPLTAIRGAAFNLADGLVKEPAAIGRYAGLILRNAEELTTMIENVLAYSASLHSAKDDTEKKFEVGDLLEHAATAMAQEIEHAGCRIEVTIAPRLPTVAGDPAAIELVFRNLIGNAVRHGAGGKWIGVSAARLRNGVEVRVCDRGPGIPENERERIFEPFYRAEQTRAHRVPGTGLGLSLAKSTIERYKGTVEARNSPGGGAQFTVRLPAAAQAL